MSMATIALILGIVALVFGGSAVGIALTHAGPTGSAGATGATGAQGTQGAQGTPGRDGTNATDLWAIVNSTGGVVAGNGVNASTTEWISGYPGAYEVLFDQPVSSCSYLATIGISGVPPPGFISVAPRYSSTWGVFVQTYDSSGVATNESFELGVFC